MSEQPAKALPPPPSFEEQLIEWRRERFLALNFNNVQAGALARSKVDYHRVAKVLSQGCTVDLAVRIFL